MRLALLAASAGARLCIRVSSSHTRLCVVVASVEGGQALFVWYRKVVRRLQVCKLYIAMPCK